jgi:methyl-accepting chemotaxis protein
MKKKLTLKVLVILGATLTFGFVSLGAIAIWLQFTATMDLQMKQARTVAAIIMKDIDEYMMKGDSNEVNRYIREAKEKKFLLNLNIYTAEGKEAESTNTVVEPLILQALEKGKTLEFEKERNGLHTLNVVVPLPNEERCQSCHDKGPKYLGGLFLTTSIQEGYDSSRKLGLLLGATGLVFFLGLLVAMYLFFRRAIIRHIVDFATTVDDLASGGGDLTRTLPVTSDDEIGWLAQGINRLIGTIREMVSSIAGNAVELSAAAHQLQGTSNRMADGIGEAVGLIWTFASAREAMAASS